MPDFPKLEAGVLDPDGQEHAPALVGQLALQGRVEREGTVDLFDAVFQPKGFTVVSTVADPRSMLSAAQLRGLERLRTTFAHIGAPGMRGADAADVDGTYRDYFDRHGIAAVVARPDFYVFGAAIRMDDLPALVDRLLQQIGSRNLVTSAPHDAQASAPACAAS